jgi:hypothetical protein
MMKDNPQMYKSMMEAQGMKIDDSQMEMMTKFMTPEFVKMAQQMQGAGGMPNMGNQGANIAQNSPFGMPNMNGDQAEMMKKMSSQMLDNPEMIKNMMNMMSSDPNNPIMKMIQDRFPNTNPQTLAKVMSIMSYFVMVFVYARKIWSYTVTKILLMCLVIYVVMWFFK